MDYKKYIDDNQSQIINTLIELVKIDSVGSEPVVSKEGMKYPFGAGVQEAFDFMINKGKEFDFEAVNIDNYGGHLEFGVGDEIVGILGHLDVVPAGDFWDCPPFGAVEKDGYIYGRGTTDDKGPVVAAMYAMHALKQCGFVPDRRIRLILGLDEETNWEGMNYYNKHVEDVTFGFTPDADFPIIFGEKGIIQFDLARKFKKNENKGLEISRMEGGNAANMVCDKVKVVLISDDPDKYADIKEHIKAFKEETKYTVTYKGVGKSLEITFDGISAHGANPHLGLNAISIAMKFLKDINLTNEEQNDFINIYNEHIGFEINGKSLGIYRNDVNSGDLSLNVGKVKVNRQMGSLTIDSRYPITCNEEEVYDSLQDILLKYDMGIVKGKSQGPVYMDKESNLIKTLCNVYSENTGDFESKPITIGGGTYARSMSNIVAFGAAFPDDEDRMHQKNERISKDRLIQLTKIYADAIMRISQSSFEL